MIAKVNERRTSLANPRSLAHRAARRLAFKLPQRPRAKLALRLERGAYRRFLSERIGVELDPPLVGPIPAAEIIAETSGMVEGDAHVQAQPDAYLATAYSGGLLTLRAAERGGVNLRTLGALLDFGCGPGRYVRVWREIHGVRLVGVDINPRQIDWARQNIPGCEFVHTQSEPPLPFADQSFDLISAASVFTHIPLKLQQLWLDELHRILRPSGVLVATVAGRAHTRRQLDEARLARDTAVEIGAEDAGLSHASLLTGQLDVFQTRAEVIRVFGGCRLELVDYLQWPGNHDVLVLRRPDGGVTR